MRNSDNQFRCHKNIEDIIEAQLYGVSRLRKNSITTVEGSIHFPTKTEKTFGMAFSDYFPSTRAKMNLNFALNHR